MKLDPLSVLLLFDRTRYTYWSLKSSLGIPLRNCTTYPCSMASCRYHADFCVTIYRINSQDRGSMIEAFLPFTCEETKSKLPLSAEQAHVLSGNLMSGTPKTLLLPL